MQFKQNVGWHCPAEIYKIWPEKFLIWMAACVTPKPFNIVWHYWHLSRCVSYPCNRNFNVTISRCLLNCMWIMQVVPQGDSIHNVKIWSSRPQDHFLLCISPCWEVASFPGLCWFLVSSYAWYSFNLHFLKHEQTVLWDNSFLRCF